MKNLPYMFVITESFAKLEHEPKLLSEHIVCIG